MEKVRTEIRQGLIKQTLFNKMVFNENESNCKWGLIESSDKRLRLAPLYSYDYCAGVEMLKKDCHRVTKGNREDIESFMVEFGKEPWFREWIKTSVLPLDFTKAVADMERKTGIILSEDEKSYYSFAIGKMYSKIVSVHDLNYDKELVEKSKKEKLGDKVKRLKVSVTDRLEDVKSLLSKNDSERNR